MNAGPVEEIILPDNDDQEVANVEERAGERPTPADYHEVNNQLDEAQPNQEMEIAAAIRDLMEQQELRTNQRMEDNRAALAQQLNAQQGVLDKLVRRVVAPPPANVVHVHPPPAAAVRAILGADLGYDGTKGEAVVTWLKRVNQKAQAEGWTDADTLRAAKGALTGKALEWQDGIGHAINNWAQWSTALLAQFDIKLNDFQWMLMVEGRKQLPNESGGDYALAKRTLIVRRATRVTDDEMVRILIRGLYNPDHRAAMLNNLPGDLTEFMAEIARLEGITKPPLSPDEIAAMLSLAGMPAANPPVSPTAPLVQPTQETHTMQSIGTALKTLTERLEAMETRQARPQSFSQGAPAFRPSQTWRESTTSQNGTVNLPAASSTPVTMPQAITPLSAQTGASTSPRPAFSSQNYRPIDSRVCYRCSQSGHIGRDCPTYPGPAPQRTGNGQAGPMGQSGQQQ